MVWLAASAVGMMIAARFLKREKTLEQLISFVSMTELEISHYSLAFSEIVEKAATEKSYDCLLFIPLCFEKITNGTDFPKAWKESISEKMPEISKNDEKKLLSFGDVLSSCDKEGVLSVLSYYKKTFDESLLEAKQARKKYAKLCVAVGVFAGGVIFMTLI